MSNIIQLNEEAIKNQLNNLVRNTIEETLHDLLDKEADRC
jgi:putative transposase